MSLEKQEPGETPFDSSGLKLRGITTRGELNAAEAANIARAMARYLTVRPSRKLARFDYSWCLRLHKQMFGEVWKWAGKVRMENLNLGSPWQRIASDLQSLLDDLHSWTGFGMDLVEQSARLHYRAVTIHPFVNGNGRWARLVANIWLKQNGQPLVLWPETTIGDTSTIRTEYLAAIRAVDQGDYDVLIGLHRRFAGDANT